VVMLASTAFPPCAKIVTPVHASHNLCHSERFVLIRVNRESQFDQMSSVNALCRQMQLFVVIVVKIGSLQSSLQTSLA